MIKDKAGISYELPLDDSSRMPNVVSLTIKINVKTIILLNSDVHIVVYCPTK